MAKLQREPRSEDTDVDALPLSALTAAFTRLAVAVKTYVTTQSGLGPVPAQTSDGGALHPEQAEDPGTELPEDLIANEGCSAITTVDVNKEAPLKRVPPGLPGAKLHTSSAGGHAHPNAAATAPVTTNTHCNAAAAPATTNAQPNAATAPAITNPAPTNAQPNAATAPAITNPAPSTPNTLPVITGGTHPLSAHILNRLASLVQASVQPLPGVASPWHVASLVLDGPSAGRWYCVSQGRVPGVYPSWTNVSPLVTGVPRAVFFHYGTKEEALDAYLTAYVSGDVIRR